MARVHPQLAGASTTYSRIAVATVSGRIHDALTTPEDVTTDVTNPPTSCFSRRAETRTVAVTQFSNALAPNRRATITASIPRLSVDPATVCTGP